MKFSVRAIFACFIVAAGMISLFLPDGTNVVMFCLGAAAGYVAPKPTGDPK